MMFQLMTWRWAAWSVLLGLPRVTDPQSFLVKSTRHTRDSCSHQCFCQHEWVWVAWTIAHPKGCKSDGWGDVRLKHSPGHTDHTGAEPEKRASYHRWVGPKWLDDFEDSQTTQRSTYSHALTHRTSCGSTNITLDKPQMYACLMRGLLVWCLRGSVSAR